MRASAPSQKDHKVDTSVSIRVFEWRGALHLAVDLVGPVLGRRYAPHRRLASFTVASLPGLQPPEATEWAIAQLTLWLNAGMPTDGRAAAPGCPGGGRSGARASRDPQGDAPPRPPLRALSGQRPYHHKRRRPP